MQKCNTPCNAFAVQCVRGRADEKAVAQAPYLQHLKEALLHLVHELQVHRVAAPWVDLAPQFRKVDVRERRVVPHLLRQ